MKQPTKNSICGFLLAAPKIKLKSKGMVFIKKERTRKRCPQVKLNQFDFIRDAGISAAMA